MQALTFSITPVILTTFPLLRLALEQEDAASISPVKVCWHAAAMVLHSSFSPVAGVQHTNCKDDAKNDHGGSGCSPSVPGTRAIRNMTGCYSACLTNGSDVTGHQLY